MAAVVDETFEEGLARLRLEGLEGGGENSPLPARLAVSEIALAPAVFQGRGNAKADGSTDGGHLAALVRALAAKSRSCQFLDPVTVYRVGAKAYLVDGHHRLAAYRAAKTTLPVPVRWFEGSLEGAVQESAGSNQKAKLPMRPQERQEMAWRLTIMGGASKRRVAEVTGASERAIASMRATLQEYREKFPEEPVGGLWDTRRRLAGDETDWRWSEEEVEAAIEEIVERARKAFGGSLNRRPDQFAEALLRFCGVPMTQEIATYWGHKPDADEEYAF